MNKLQKAVFNVAKHELGHWLAWYASGFESKGIEIKIYSVHGRHTGAALPILSEPILGQEATLRYVRARLLCLHAGIYSESFLGSDYDGNNIFKNFAPGGSASSDYHKTIELMWLYCNLLQTPDKYTQVCEEIDQETAHLIADNFDFIKTTANKISLMATHEGQEITVSHEKLRSWYHHSNRETANDTD